MRGNSGKHGMGTRLMKMAPVRDMRSALAIALALFTIGLSTVGMPLRAQPAESGAAPGVICMASTASEGDQLLIILPPRNVSSMLGKGFAVVPCNKAFPTPTDREQWRDSICQLAALQLEYVQKQFASDHGVRAQELCGMAELATSQWQKQRVPGQ